MGPSGRGKKILVGFEYVLLHSLKKGGDFLTTFNEIMNQTQLYTKSGDIGSPMFH